MKYCATTTTFKNPASIQNLLNLSCCDNFSISSPYLCTNILFVQDHHHSKARLSWSRLAQTRNSTVLPQRVSPFYHEKIHILHTFLRLLRKDWADLQINCAKNSCNRFLVGTIVDRQFSTAFAFSTDLWTMDSWLERLGVRFLRVSPSSFPPFCPIQPCGLSSLIEYHFSLNQDRETTIVLIQIFSHIEKRVEHSTRILFHCLLIHNEMSLNIDMKIILPVRFSGVSPDLNRKLLTFWLSCKRIESREQFHSNSIGSPSMLSKVLYSGWTLEPLQSFSPCDVWSRVLVHLSKTQYRIWKYVNLCALKIDDFLITNQRQILQWRISPINCFHSIDLILFGYQFLRYVEHLFHCEIFCVLDGMPIVWIFLSPWKQMIAMLKTWTFLISQNVFRCLRSHPLKIVLAFFALDLDPNDNSDSVSSYPMTNCCALAPPRGQTTGFTVLSWFFSSSKMKCLCLREKRDWNACAPPGGQTTGFSVLSPINKSDFHSWEDQALSTFHWVACWVCAFNGSVMVVLVICVTANNGFLRSVILFSLHSQRTLTFISLSSLGFLMQKMTELRAPLHLIIGLDFAVTLSSPDSSCVIVDITSEQSVELKWLMLNKQKRWFHSSHVQFPLVSMSASWFLVSIHLIWIFGSELIRSNNPSRATLWVLETCLICLASSLHGNLDHCFVLQTHTTKLLDAKIGRLREPGRPYSKHWTFLQIALARDSYRGKQRVSPFYHGCDSCFQGLKTMRSHKTWAGIPSNLNPASKAIISDSVELCEKLRFASYTPNLSEQMYDFQICTMFHLK